MLGKKPRKDRAHLTLDEDLLEELTRLAKRTGASVSAVAGGLIREALQGDGAVDDRLWVKVERMAEGVEALRAEVLPLVATVNRLLAEAGYEASKGSPPAAQEGPKAPPKIASYAEMYGPIGPAEPAATPRPPDPQASPSSRWRWRR